MPEFAPILDVGAGQTGTIGDESAGTGTVTILVGSPTMVTGTGTLFFTEISPHPNPFSAWISVANVAYQVATIISNTILTLKIPAAAAAGASYKIVKPKYRRVRVHIKTAGVTINGATPPLTPDPLYYESPGIQPVPPLAYNTNAGTMTVEAMY